MLIRALPAAEARAIRSPLNPPPVLLKSVKTALALVRVLYNRLPGPGIFLIAAANGSRDFATFVKEVCKSSVFN